MRTSAHRYGAGPGAHERNAGASADEVSEYARPRSDAPTQMVKITVVPAALLQSLPGVASHRA